MSFLPDHEPQRIPEGRYIFKLKEMPEKRRKSSSRGGKDFVTVMFTFIVTGEEMNERQHTESFLPWNIEYGQLLEALGGKRDESDKVHLGDEAEELVGKSVKADIEHKEDKKDPSKSWARMTNIQAIEDDDELPF